MTQHSPAMSNTPTATTLASLTELTREQLIAQVQELEQTRTALEDKRFIDATLAQLAETMRWQAGDTLNSWADRLLEALVRQVNGMQATLYRNEPGLDRLQLAGSFAAPSTLAQTVALGEGLTGQAALTRQQQYYGDQVPFYAVSESVLAKVEARALVIQPLLYNDQLEGVLEITAYQALTPKDLSLLQAVSESIAANLSTLTAQDKIQRLYQEAQEKSEALLAQEEELRQNLEELEATQEQMRNAQVHAENQRQQIQTIIDTSEDMIVAMDRNLILTHCNKAFADRYSRRGIDVRRGLTFDEIFAGNENYDALLNMCRKALGGDSFSFELHTNATENLPEGWFHVQYKPIYDTTGEVTGFVSQVRNTTAAKLAEVDIQQKNEELEAQQEELRQNLEELEATQEQIRHAQVFAENQRREIQTIIDLSEDMIAAANQHLVLTHCNAAYRTAMLKYGVDVQIGMNFDEMFQELDTREQLKQLAKRALTGEKFSYEMHSPALNGMPESWLLVLYSPITDADGNVSGYVSTIRNVTEQKSREERYRKQQTALQQLAKNSDLTGGDVDRALELVTRTLAETLNVGQLGIWLYNEDAQSIVSRKVYDAPKEAFSQGLELTRKDFPSYFAAIDTGEILVCEDVKTHPAVVEFQGYFAQFGIGSMCDIPVRRLGKMIGVICAEHLGDARQWTSDEQAFMSAVAEMISLALEAADRKNAMDVVEANERKWAEYYNAKHFELREIKKELKTLREEHNQLVALQGAVAQLLATAEYSPEGKLLTLNSRMAELMGGKTDGLIGKHHGQLIAGADEQVDEETLWSALATGKPVQVSEFCPAGKKHSWSLNSTYQPVLNAEGKVVKVLQVALAERVGQPVK